MSAVLRQIEALDPVRDAFRITFLSTTIDFPLDTHLALEFAFFRTFCSPSIAALLDRTGEFHRRPQKRHDDTVLLIAEMIECGLESERGRQALERMNAIHSRFRISNTDHLYVLSTFVLEPIRWNRRYGWRLATAREREAGFQVWREIGRRMGIRDIPERYEELEAFNIDYERRNFRYNEASRRVGTSTLELFVSWYPRPLAPLVRNLVYSVLDDPVREAFGFPRPPEAMQRLVPGMLEVLGRSRRFLPERRKPVLRHGMRYPTYPDGYRIDQLGPS